VFKAGISVARIDKMKLNSIIENTTLLILYLITYISVNTTINNNYVYNKDI